MKTQQATNEEINEYIDKYHNGLSTGNLPPGEQADLAGEIANALGRLVRVNGLHIHPDKPKDRAGSIGTNIVIGTFGFMLLVIVLGVLAYVVSVVAR